MSYQPNFLHPPPGFVPNTSSQPSSMLYTLPTYPAPPPASIAVPRPDFSYPPPVPGFTVPPPHLHFAQRSDYATTNFKAEHSAPPPNYYQQPPPQHRQQAQGTQNRPRTSRFSQPPYVAVNAPPPPVLFNRPPPPKHSQEQQPSRYRQPSFERSSRSSMPHTSERSRSYMSSASTNERSRYSTPSTSNAGSAHSSRNRRERDKNTDSSTVTEREELLSKWRSNFCEHFDDITRKLAELDPDNEKAFWIRSSPADIYYNRTSHTEMQASPRLVTLCTLFENELVNRGEQIRSKQIPYVQLPRRRKHKICRHKSEKCSSSDSSSEEFDVDEEDCSMEELTKKIQHPYRLHADLWHNEPGEMNDGPLCRCSVKSKRSGIRHGIYPGENGFSKCDPNTNNAKKLYHYRITISPPTNFLTKTPTIIKYDQHEFIFEGFSLLSHVAIGELPTCKVIRFNIEYTILYIEEKMPENFTIRELDIFYQYLFVELLEMLDLNLKPGLSGTDSCSSFHFLPRFVRDLPDNGKEVLAMSEVLRYLLDSAGALVPRATLEDMMNISQHDWQNYVDNIKDMVVTNPGMKPCSVRVDQLDRNVSDLPECIDVDDKGIIHPVIVHFGIRPPQLSYAGNPDYQKAWREYVKFRHLVANMSKPSYEDKRKLEFKENRLQEMRTQGRMKRNITVAISSKGFFRTGIMCDIVQHAMLIPVLTTHLRFHQALDVLETNIGYKFQNRYILQLALTHPSYKENFGTNPDHARNSLTNCGIRQPEYGDRKIHYMNTRKRGINTLINIMSRFGKEYETDSNISHNERLEFLGDAVVEFLTSIHLFFMFPDLEEGGLATYRAAIVQNQHLAVLARKLHLEEFMLYAHGSDLCHELELRHAMANCFEALMGALLLDGGINVADKVFGLALFEDAPDMKEIWENIPPHPLQEQEPHGDRQWIAKYQLLKDLTKFEESIGISFRHIRLLARAFTDRSIGFTHLTLGSNQRLEFLGDTVLQLICSEYLYRHFPEHHEGHLSLLRSSLVNNRTQSVVCDDLGMTQYAVYSNPKPDLKTKDRADLLEAFLGALYVDNGLDPCQTFCQVCLFPRLQVFIMNQDWNDPKSKLQQCCLTLRTMDGGEPDIPLYKVIECIGPTNTRVYTVAVYFRGKRLASATGHSIQQAEMNAAKAALENSRDLFPQLDHQKRVIAQSIKRQKGKDYSINGTSAGGSNTNGGIDSSGRFSPLYRRDVLLDDESNLPKQYRTREDISSDELRQSDSGKSSAETRRKRSKRKKRRASGDLTRSPPSSAISSAHQLHKRPRTEATTLMESIMQQHGIISSASSRCADRPSSCSSIEEVAELQTPAIVPKNENFSLEGSEISSTVRSRLSSCSSIDEVAELQFPAIVPKTENFSLEGSDVSSAVRSRLSSCSSISEVAELQSPAIVPKNEIASLEGSEVSSAIRSRLSSCSSIDEVAELQSPAIVPKTENFSLEGSEVSSAVRSRLSSCSSIDEEAELQSPAIFPKTENVSLEGSEVSSAMRSRLSSCSSLPSADEIDVSLDKRVDIQLYGGQHMPLPKIKSRLSSISSMSSFETLSSALVKTENVSSDDDIASVESGEIS